jgi:cytochrome c556
MSSRFGAFNLKSIRPLVLSALLSGFAAAALADPAGDAAVGARQSLMRLQAYCLGQLFQMAQGKIPYDAKAATIAADNLVSVTAFDVAPLFPAGTDNASNDKTHALPAIWQGTDDFLSKYADMHKAALSVQTAAAGGADGLKAALGGLGGTCGACHKEYRAPLS